MCKSGNLIDEIIPKWNTKEQCGTVPPCHGRPEFVYPGCWHFDNSATSKFDDVLLEHGRLPHVRPLAVHPN